MGDAKFAALKTFLQRHAKSYDAQSLARTYAAFIDKKVVGYITLVCGEVAIGDEDAPLIVEDGLQYHYRQYPAVKIARLAVDVKYRDFKLGKALVQLAFGTSKSRICPAVGCRFVVVDAKVDAIGFYEACGFTMLDTESNKARPEPVMFVDLSKLTT